MRQNALLLALLVVLATVVLLWSRGTSTPLAAPPRLGAPAPGAPAPGDAAPKADTGRPEAAPERAVVARGGALVPRGPVRAISGRFVVVDEGGAEHRAEDGSFRLVVWRDDRGETLPVEVHEGHWSAEVPEGIALGVRDLELGGRPALVAGSSARRYPVPADGSLELRAAWPAPSLLHVRDAHTQAELTGVRVVRAKRYGSEDAHPGPFAPEDVVVAGAPSPVEVPHGDDPGFLRSGQARYFVAAPGHAWSAVTLGADHGAPQAIALEPGGDVRFEIRGASRSSPDARLRLRRPGSRSWAPAVDLPLDGRAEVLVESLPTGAFSATVELGPWTDDPRVLGSTELEVVAGEERRATLATAGAPPELERVPLSGVLLLPAEWGLGEFRLVVTRRDEAARTTRPIRIDRADMEPSGDDAYAWDAGAVPPGEYEVALTETHTRVLVDVRAPGVSDARIEVPPPGRVSLQVVDTTTERDADVDRVVWSSPATGAVTIVRNPSTGRFDFQAPRGEIEVHVPTFEYVSRRERLVVGEGVTDARLEVRPASRVLVRAFEGDRPVPWDLSWELAIDSRPVPARLQDGGALLSIEEPGVHEVALAPVAGFRPVAPREVEAVEGAVTELVFQLERAR